MKNDPGIGAVGNDLPAEEEILGDAAYALLTPEFMALKPEDLLVINVDVPTVVAMVIGSLPEIRALLPELETVVPEVDLALLNKLRLCALALSYAHARYLSSAAPSGELQQLTESGVALRETLLTDATALARRGLVENGKLNDLQGVIGFKNVAVDLTILASVLKERWPEIQGKCAVSASELDTALRIAERIFTAVGLREQGSAAIESTTEMRLRLFTLLSRIYDLVRKAVGFVRWDFKDAEKIAPSLYTGRTRRRGGSGVDAPPPANPPGATPPAVPVPVPVTAGGAAATAPSEPTNPLNDPFM